MSKFKLPKLLSDIFKYFAITLELYFPLTINESDQNILINRFDIDHDGDIDMHEFFEFIESEKQNLHIDPQHESEQLQKIIKKSNQSNEDLGCRDGIFNPYQYRPEWDSSPPRRVRSDDYEDADSGNGGERGSGSVNGGRSRDNYGGRNIFGVASMTKNGTGTGSTCSWPRCGSR